MIVIDPGHGGDEAGAKGRRGLLEKDVTLAVSKKLAAELKKRYGYRVYLTRTSDRTLTLEERDEFAVKKGADLFISIHANASKDRKSRGIETYYLNNASDEAAERLARRENMSAGKKLSDVEHILSTMLQNYDTAESRDLAGDVQRSLVRHMGSSFKGIKSRGVRSALFYVLVGAKCPAILVETSFISNPADEKRLRNPKYQDGLASGVSEGVHKFMTLRDKRIVSL